MPQHSVALSEFRSVAMLVPQRFIMSFLLLLLQITPHPRHNRIGRRVLALRSRALPRLRIRVLGRPAHVQHLVGAAQALLMHGLLGEFGRYAQLVLDKCDEAQRLQSHTAHSTPLGKLGAQSGLELRIRLQRGSALKARHVQRAIVAIERADASHVLPLGRVAVAAENVLGDGSLPLVVRARHAVKVGAVGAARTLAAREMQANE